MYVHDHSPLLVVLGSRTLRVRHSAPSSVPLCKTRIVDAQSRRALRSEGARESMCNDIVYIGAACLKQTITLGIVQSIIQIDSRRLTKHVEYMECSNDHLSCRNIVRFDWPVLSERLITLRIKKRYLASALGF